MVSELRKNPETAEQVAFRERRERLLKRLWWKAPIIIVLITFAAWWQLRQEESAKLASQAVAPEVSKLAQALTGVWQGEVSYSRGLKYIEQFFFQPEAHRLYGTASFLGHKRGIENGIIQRDGLSFDIRYQEVLGDTATSRMNRYRGKLVGDEIRLSMQDDREGAPVEFSISKKSDAP